MTEVLVMILAVLLMKLAALAVGYLIVRLGFDVLVRGIKGEFDFGGKVSDRVELKLLNRTGNLGGRIR